MGGASKTDVVIVGGGLAGLSSGLALARAGIDTVVIESQRAPTHDVFGFILWPSASRCLQWLGVLDDVVEQGVLLEAVRWLVAGRNGNRWLTIDTAKLNAGAFLGVQPSRLVSVLRAAAEASGVDVVEAVDEWSVHRDGTRWAVHIARDGTSRTVTTPLLVGADGSNSTLRRTLGLVSSRWQPKGQVILTGVGGRVPFRESRQAVSAHCSSGCVDLGGRSWVYVVTREADVHDPATSIRHYAALDTASAAAFDKVERIAQVRPWSIRVPQWARDGAVLMGDAAHGMLPHFGLGGTLTLEDVPVLCEVIGEALHSSDTSMDRLGAFQQRRRARVGYAQRVSNRWAGLLTTSVPGVGLARDLNLRRMANNTAIIEKFYQELAFSAVPSFATRLRMLFP